MTLQILRARRVLAADRRGSSWPVRVETEAGVFFTKLRGAGHGLPALVADIIVAGLAQALGSGRPPPRCPGRTAGRAGPLACAGPGAGHPPVGRRGGARRIPAADAGPRSGRTASRGIRGGAVEAAPAPSPLRSRSHKLTSLPAAVSPYRLTRTRGNEIYSVHPEETRPAAAQWCPGPPSAFRSRPRPIPRSAYGTLVPSRGASRCRPSCRAELRHRRLRRDPTPARGYGLGLLRPAG
jgi:hypothetical protein